MLFMKVYKKGTSQSSIKLINRLPSKERRTKRETETKEKKVRREVRKFCGIVYESL